MPEQFYATQETDPYDSDSHRAWSRYQEPSNPGPTSMMEGIYSSEHVDEAYGDSLEGIDNAQLLPGALQSPHHPSRPSSYPGDSGSYFQGTK